MDTDPSYFIIFQSSRNDLRTRGFTLIEMMVSLMIFSVVAVVALGAVIKIVSTNQKAQTLESAITNMNFALDSMSRDLRVGSSYVCGTTPAFPMAGNNCSGGVTGSTGAVIVFQSPKFDSNDNCYLSYAYRFNPVTSTNISIQKAQQITCGASAAWGSWSPIVSSNVTITSSYIQVSNDPYPLIYIEITGYAGDKELDRTYFDMDTAVSPRTP